MRINPITTPSTPESSISSPSDRAADVGLAGLALVLLRGGRPLRVFLRDETLHLLGQDAMCRRCIRVRTGLREVDVLLVFERRACGPIVEPVLLVLVESLDPLGYGDQRAENSR